jgi:hypothetical protein
MAQAGRQPVVIVINPPEIRNMSQFAKALAQLCGEQVAPQFGVT